MSATEFHLTDADLDLALDGLLLGGSEEGAEPVVGRAMLAIAGVRQRRRGLASLSLMPRPRVLVYSAAILLAVVAGYGAWRVVELAVGPSPTPSPSPSLSATPRPTPLPTPAETATTTFSELVDGYRIELPGSWHAVEGGAPGRRTFEGGERFGSVTVSYGSADGTLTVCLFYQACHDVTVASLAAFSSVLGLSSSPFKTMWNGEIGGEPATFFEVANLDVENASFLGGFAMHGTRPLLLSFGSRDRAFVRTMVDISGGLTFVDGTTHAYPESGYRITLPDEWTVGDPGAFYHVAAPERHLSVVAGTGDGHLASCQILPTWVPAPEPSLGPDCIERTFGSTADLSALFPGMEDVGPLVVGGEATRLLRHYTFDGYYYVVPIVHGGRPYLIYPNFTMVIDAFEVPATTALQMVDDALSGFEFLP